MTPEATELLLYIENEPGYYRSVLWANGTLAGHWARGTFTAERAPKVFARLVADAARNYNTEHGAYAGPPVFSKADRDQVADYLAAVFATTARTPDVWADLGDRAARILARHRAG
jgi:hypothetical protein